jgi:amino acid transporter
MAVHGAIPKYFGKIHPRHLTPGPSTLWMGALSIVWYVGLTIVSENILFDSIAALGLMIAFYYGLTGFACVVYFRKALFRSAKNLVLAGLAPLVGGLMLGAIFVKSCIDLAKPANSESGSSWFGLGPPLVISIGFLIMGIVLMALYWRASPEFFNRKPEVAAAEALDG